MGGSKQQATTTTSNSEPWDAAQPSLKLGLADAQNLYKSGVGSQAYTGSTVIPYSQSTLQGMGDVKNIAAANMGGGGVSGQYQNAINSGGFSPWQNSALSGLSGFSSGAHNVSTAGTDFLGNAATQNPALTGYSNAAGGGLNTSAQNQLNLMQQGMGPSYSEQNLAGIARGDMLDREDPHFERALQAARENMSNEISMGASGSGRYGSGTHQGAIAKNVGDYEASQRVNRYMQERANQMAANSQLDSSRMAGLGFGLNAANSASGINQANSALQMQGLGGMGSTYANSIGQALGAAGQSAGIQQNNNAQQLGAYQQLFNGGQQGFNNLGTAYSGMTNPARDMMGIGSMYEDLAGRMKNDELRIFQEQQNSPWNQLGRLNSVATGAGTMGGTSTGTALTPGQSPFATGLGYMSGVGSLLGSFGRF